MEAVYISHAGARWNLDDLVENLTISGDYKQAARSATLSIVEDRAGIVASITPGELISFSEFGTEVFRGYVFALEKNTANSTRSIRLYDAAIYLLKSNVAHNWINATAQSITRQVAAELGVPVGAMPTDWGLPLSFAHMGKSAYAAIMGAWTQVSKKTSVKYLLRVIDGRLNVVVMGAVYAPCIIDPKTNLIDAKVSISIENAITQALLVDEQGRTRDVATDDDRRRRYGILQAIQTDRSKPADLRSALKPEETQSTLEEIIGGAHMLDCVAGNAVTVHDPKTGLHGRYYILTDEHTFSGGHHKLTLGLSLDALMDDTEVNEVKKAEEEVKKTAGKREKAKPTGDPFASAAAYGRKD